MISVSFEGIAKSVQLVEELIVPWKREHAQELAKIEESERRTRIALLEADLSDRAAKTALGAETAKTLRAKAAQEREKAKKMRLENKRLEVRYQREMIEMLIAMAERIAPGCDEITRTELVLKLLPHVKGIMASPLELTFPARPQEEEQQNEGKKTKKRAKRSSSP